MVVEPLMVEEGMTLMILMIMDLMESWTMLL